MLGRLGAIVLFCILTACAANGHGVNALPAPNPTEQTGRGAFFQGAAGVARVYQPDWAGPVLFAGGAKPLQIPARRFASVEGEWVVPKALPTINCSNPKEPEDGSSLWIALDGWMATFKAHYMKDGRWHTYDSTDILQAGSESDVPCYHGGPLRDYRTTAYFWIEWSGDKNVAVEPHHRTNLPLNAGDRIYVRIAATTTGPKAWREATLWFVNETTGFVLPSRTFHSGCIDCGTPYQRPATLFGNTVEWITEATFYSSLHRSLFNTLDDFGTVAMSHAIATDEEGTMYDPVYPRDATPNVDWMTWNGVPLNRNGTLLACSAILGPRQVAFARAPYVIATPGQQGKLDPKPQRCR